jgi:hypothetical protein
MAVVSMLAQDYKDLVGKWSMTSETNEDPVKWVLVLKEADGKLAATLASEQGELPIKDVNYTDGVLKFKAPYHDVEYDIELKLMADKLVGTWSGDGNSGKTSGVKM